MNIRRRIFIFLAVIFLSATAIIFITYNKKNDDTGRLSEQISADIPIADSTDQGFTHEGDRYVNTTYGFSFALRSEYKTQSNSVWEDAKVFTFDAEGEKSFQIFIMPHDEPAITSERIKLDIPDIVINNVRAATLDGADALAFGSTDASLGETYEVWFVQGGHLYQITTYTANEQELNSILQTWKFTL